jgi:hypothetical protein
MARAGMNPAPTTSQGNRQGESPPKQHHYAITQESLLNNSLQDLRSIPFVGAGFIPARAITDLSLL